jgi:hypothetical protein
MSLTLQILRSKCRILHPLSYHFEKLWQGTEVAAPNHSVVQYKMALKTDRFLRWVNAPLEKEHHRENEPDERHG